MRGALMNEEHGTDASTAGSSAERIARNDAIFRKANEGISRAAALEEIEGSVPYVCECADPGCRDTVHLTAEEYGHIREDARTFWNVPGHQASSQGWAQVIETFDRYVVVVKIGPAGDVAEQLEGAPDPATAAVKGDAPYRRGNDG